MQFLSGFGDESGGVDKHLFQPRAPTSEKAFKSGASCAALTLRKMVKSGDLGTARYGGSAAAVREATVPASGADWARTAAPPRYLTSFVGSEREIEEITRLLAESSRHCLWLA